MLFKRKNSLSTKEMIKLEEKTKEKKICELVKKDNLLEELSLKLDYVDINEDKSWDQNTEAILMPCNDNEYNGVIKVQKKYGNSKFAYIHEIIHYVIDADCKKVTETYTRKTKGNTPDKHEQEINYITAAATMPIDEIRTRLLKYDNSSPKEDEVKMIAELSEKYQQKKSVIIRRIQEVRRIDAYKKLI